jgi:carboxyl-terminal processing protease
MATPTTGYVRINEFTADAPARITQAFEALAKTGAVTYVLDLRGSARGDLDHGLAAARLFVPSGTLAVRETRVENNQLQKDTIAAQPNDGAITAPVVLLVDLGTAGAAELFAAALDGNDRTELIGERTLGSVARQRLIKLPDGSGLLLSTVRYLSPSSEAIHQQGLTPDVPVAQPDIEFGADLPAGDPTLDKALEEIGVKKAA